MSDQTRKTLEDSAAVLADAARVLRAQGCHHIANMAAAQAKRARAALEAA